MHTKNNPGVRILPALLLVFFSHTTFASDSYQRLQYQERSITIEYPYGFSTTEKRATYLWLKEVSEALLTVYDQLPQERTIIEIKRTRSRYEAVPWGHVERNRIPKVVLVINPELGFGAIRRDWTAYHELSHLFIPYKGWGDVWLSEGLATYYQNVTRVRTGDYSESKFWDKITSGLERGRRQHRWSHLTLTEVSNRQRETRQYMRIHWSGVLYWLLADASLRKANRGSLDVALLRLNQCCQQQRLSAKEIVSQLDDLMGTQLFVPLFNDFSGSRHLPEYDALLSRLGIKQTGQWEEIELSEQAPLSNIRKAITSRQ